MNPLNPKQLSRLRDAVEWSRRRLQVYRENQYESVRQFVGFHYSDDGASDRVPVNMLELFVSIYIHHLAAKRPQTLITAKNPDLRRTSERLEMGVNHLLEEIAIEKTIRVAVKQALFSMGIVKTGISRYAQVEVGGFLHDVGQPYSDPISLDDWVHDMAAKRLEQAQMMGNRYRIDADSFMESDFFTNKDKVEVFGADTLTNEQGDPRIEEISQGQSAQDGRFRDEVELWDVWLPLENLLVTLQLESDAKPFAIMEWDGPEEGPFDMLSYCDVPGQIMPLAPIANLIDMHDLANRLFRKLGRQAERQKTVLGVQGGHMDDGERIVKSDDGDVIRVDNPDRAREYNFGGVHNENLAFLLQVRQLFTYFGGNLDSLGGLTPQSETVGQDRMLSENASRRVAEMQRQTVTFVQSIIKKLTFYAYYDPMWNPEMAKRVPGTDLKIPVGLTPEDREHDYLDFNYTVEPHSMTIRSPSERMQQVMQIYQGVLGPGQEFMAQQGMGINYAKLIEIIAQLGNLPELQELIISQEPLEQDAPVGKPPAKSAYSHRVNERVNRPGATMAGNENIMSQLLMGGNPQQSEKNSVVRGVG